MCFKSVTCLLVVCLITIWWSPRFVWKQRHVHSGLATYTKIIGGAPWTQTHSSVLWQTAEDWYGPDLNPLPHTHVCRCSLWRRQMCLELGRRGVSTCMFSPVDHVFTGTCHAWVYSTVTGALLTSSTEHCSECTSAWHGNPVSSNRGTFNPLCLPHTPRDADGTMLRDDPYAGHASLRPDRLFAMTSYARAVVNCLGGGMHDHNTFTCTPLPVFRQRASERGNDGTWGRYTIKVCDIVLYHHITFLSSACCAMPQPGTPLQPGVFTVGRGRPCDSSHTDGRSVDSPLHEFRDAEINESAVLGTPVNDMLAAVPAFHTSAVVTGGRKKRVTLKQLGIYARLCLRLTSRLPVISPGPSMLETLSYTVPRPTVAARLRPRPRAVAKMLVRSRLRCQCCFHRLGFCMRENAWLSRPCTIWDCHGLSMELTSALSLSLPRIPAQVSRHTACDLPCQALCGSDQFEKVDVTMRRVPGFHACILMDPRVDVCKSVAYFAETFCQCWSRCDTQTCTFAPSFRHNEGSGIVYQKEWFCRPPMTFGCALITCCPVMQSLEPMFSGQGVWIRIPTVWFPASCLAGSSPRSSSSRCPLIPASGSDSDFSGSRTSCCALIRISRLSDALWGYALDSVCEQVMQDSASVAWRHIGPQLTLLRKVTRPACRVHPTGWERAPVETLRQGQASRHDIRLQYDKCRSDRQPLSMVLDSKCCPQFAVIRLLENCSAVRSVQEKLTFGRPRRLTPPAWSSGRTSRTILQVAHRICEPRFCADPITPRLPRQTMRVRCLFNRPPSSGRARLGSRCHELLDKTLDSAFIHTNVCLYRASRLWCKGLPKKLVCCFDIRSLTILISVHLPPHDCMHGTGCLSPLKDGGHWNAPADVSTVKLQALSCYCAMTLSLWSGKSMLYWIPCCCYKVSSLPGPKSGGDIICCWRCNSHVGLLNKLYWCSAESVADVRVEERAGLSSEAVVTFLVWFPDAKPTGRGATEPTRPAMCSLSCGRSLTHGFLTASMYFNSVLSCQVAEDHELHSDTLRRVVYHHKCKNAFYEPLPVETDCHNLLHALDSYLCNPLPTACSIRCVMYETHLCQPEAVHGLLRAPQAGTWIRYEYAFYHTRTRLWRRWRLRSPVHKAKLRRHRQRRGCICVLRARSRRMWRLTDFSCHAYLCTFLVRFWKPFLSVRMTLYNNFCMPVCCNSDYQMRRDRVAGRPLLSSSPLRRLVFSAVIGTRLAGVASAPPAADAGGLSLRREPGKQAYSRACQRAIRDGVTTYRGRPFSRSQVPRNMQQAASLGWLQARPPVRPRHVDGARVKLFCWNCSGLSHCHDELLHWLTMNSYDIVMLQETLWKFTNTWVNSHYVFIHSGAQKPGRPEGGLLVMISKRLVREQDVRFLDVVPGRLLRVHSAIVGTASQTVDVVAVYQHTWNTSSDILSKRSAVWTRMSETLHRISARSCLVLGGDFNVTCRPHGRHVGHGVPRKPHAATDASDFMAILEAHQLIALNTHGKAPSHTFQFGDRSSQLDYICVRLRHADTPARRAKPLEDFPVAEHTSTQAAKHFPIIASISGRWRHVNRENGPSQQPMDLARLADDVQHDSASLFPIRQEIATWVANAPVDCTDNALQSLNESLTRIGSVHYGKHSRNHASHWQDEVQVFRAQTMWKVFRKMKNQTGNLRGMFVAWRCWGQFQKMHKQYTAHSLNLRKEKRLQTLQNAREAADRHDTWGLCKIVRNIAPKCPARKFQVGKTVNC